MIITNVIVEKIEKDHPRYPEQATWTDVQFTEVYRCEITFEDGRQNEAVFFVTPIGGEMTPEKVSDMLRLFARTIVRMEQTEPA